jgi:hypothetical protein
MNRQAANRGKMRGRGEKERLIIWDFAQLGRAIIFPKMCRDIAPYQQEILTTILALSRADRGTMGRQLEKLVEAFKNSKRGPLSFSGGVEVLIYQHGLYIYPREIEVKYDIVAKRLTNIAQLRQSPFIMISNRAVNRRLNTKRLPNWLVPWSQEGELISTMELYSQLFYYHRFDENKLINCNFHNIQLI